MDNNKTYFYHQVATNGTLVTGTGYVHTNLDLRRILGAKYDKYEAFNLSLEAYMTDSTASPATNRATFCLHISGFPFMNNYYDSLNQYSSSRVIEVLSGVNETVEANQYDAHLYFLQNTHRISFYRPATPIIDRLVLFLTAPDGTLYERLGTTNLGTYGCIFSITGIDAYRVRKIPRPLIYRGFNKPNPTLVLNSAYAVSIDPVDGVTATKKRIFRFNNVNWREIIGNDLYSKYEKFALVTRRTTVNYPVNANFSIGTGGSQMCLLLSGSNLLFEYKPSYQFYATNTTVANLHTGNFVVIGVTRSSLSGGRNMKDCYVENIFYKPTEDIGTVTISYSQLSISTLQTADTATNPFVPFPILVAHFEIIPVVDVR